MRGHRSLDGLDEDVSDHIERETQENVERGMGPEEARDAARRAFGNITLAMEDTRAVWVPAWIDQVAQDARYGLRLLRRAPGFSAVAILTLAIGIGLSTAVFSVVNAVLIRPLSYPHAERLYWLGTYDDRTPVEYVSSPEFTAWSAQSSSLERSAGFFVASEAIDVGSEVVQARIAAVTDGFWDLAAVPFVYGGPPPAGEEGVVLSHAFFEHWFHGDPGVVGRQVMRYGVPTTVTGVLRPDFKIQLPPPSTFSAIAPGTIDFLRAIVLRPAEPGGGILVFNVLGLARPGVTPARVADDLQTIRAHEQRDAHELRGAAGMRFPPHLRVVPYAEHLAGWARRPLLILLASVMLVLLIACANLANLLLARGAARQREIAIRVAIGAGRGRVLRQFLVESLLLAAVGGMLGLLLARAAIALVVAWIPSAVPRLAETSIDARVLAFAAAATVATTFLFGLAPAISWWKAGVHDLLKDGARTASSSRRTVRVRTGLVALELALSVVLLVGAGLMVKSFERITAYPAGFEPDRVLTLRMQFSGARYQSPAARRAYIDEVLRRLRDAPGVEVAGGSSGGDGRMTLRVEGRPEPSPGQGPTVLTSAASGNYAAAIGMRVVRGRWLTDAEPQPAIVINEALARRVFPDGDPSGQRIRIPGRGDPRLAVIVGVVADLRYARLDARPEPELFMNYGDAAAVMSAGMTLAIRTAGDPAAAAPEIRTLLAGVDRNVPLFDVRPLDTALADSIAPRRFNTLLLGTFAGTALLLALVGIYGVIAFAVAQRTHEIGVRMALGAQRPQVVRMVARQGMSIASAGIVIGVALSLALTRLLTTMLYEVTPTDPWTFGLVVAVLAAAAFVAGCVPALRAARVDPIVALRCD
jgi:putative ABC transport system permease protein